MDRDYRKKIDELAEIAKTEDRDAALLELDTMNWRRVHSINALLKAARIYEEADRFDDARDLLEMAHERSPIGRLVIYQLALLCIRMGDLDSAQEYYDSYASLAPNEYRKYIIKYRLSIARGADDYTLIAILEELKKAEFLEDWAYELACLYHKTKQPEKCVEICDEIALYFGNGPYVEKALALKMIYQPLTKEQESQYRSLVRQGKEGNAKEEGEVDSHPSSLTQRTVRLDTMNLQEEIKKNIDEIMNATETGEVSENMEIIKNLVGEIPYVQIPKEEVRSEEKKKEEKVSDDTLRLNYQKYLSEEYDGQMAMRLPDDPDDIEIDGQMTIDDVMKNWEKTRRAAEAALEDAKQEKLKTAKEEALAEAEEIMKRLEEAKPKLDAGLAPEELLQQEYLEKGDTEEDLEGQVEEVENNTLSDSDLNVTEGDNVNFHDASQMLANVNEMLQREIDRLSEDSGTEGDQSPDMGMNSDESGEENNSSDDLTKEDREGIEKEEEIPVGTLEERQDDQSLLAAAYSTPKEEESEDSSVPDSEEDQREDAGEENPFDEDLDHTLPRLDDIDTKRVEPAPLDSSFISSDEVTAGEDGKDEDATLVSVEEDEGESPVDDGQEVTSEEDTEETEETKNSDADPSVEPEEDSIEEEDKPAPRQDLGMTTMISNALEMAAKQVRDDNTELVRPADLEDIRLSEEEKVLFSYFMPIQGMEEAIGKVITGAARRLLSSEKYGEGCIAIIGGHGSGKTTLAKGIIRVLQDRYQVPGENVGRIDAEKLNEKDLQSLYDRIRGGCLVIEGAGAMTMETAVSLSLLMDSDQEKTLIILEDDKDGMDKVLSLNGQFARKFSEKIRIPVFTVEELVNFGKTYASDNGYTIDEMAILAMYDRINSVQRLDRPTYLLDVKEIMDEAMEKASKQTFFHRKKTTEDGMIVLMEKDFL